MTARAAPALLTAILLPAVLLLAAALLGACDNMAKQPRDKTWTPAGRTADGDPDRKSWPPVPPADAIAREDVAQPPPALTPALLERGRERYEIYCTPCHGYAGDGDGMIVRRGFPHPPSFHGDALRTAPTRHFYDVVTNGWGAMYSYADRVGPDDRWAIAAYIRALQASQNTAAADLPPGLPPAAREALK
ncbi:c-type cytochrome [Azospirillum picis]|uniref:Mono/diheme cytochrome c family protein n=1 Tax=Azospirillum picis TaxID=488438 RepID=A0ABU0MRH3_9PROT|nr:cytochrome c [Azospirillum picis]MBP2302437.1 mono/diheme cytochrome c family protein [Azospirillum picis]MDQ0536016.1 mono/diheme cytochrome c family protein [Azospirillum picis]